MKTTNKYVFSPVDIKKLTNIIQFCYLQIQINKI